LAHRFGTCRAQPGGPARGVLPVPGLPTALMPPVVLVSGGAGPLLTVVAGLSGGEWHSVAAAADLGRDLGALPADALSGAVAVVPALGVMAVWHRRPRHSPVDGQVLAEAFPGAERGTTTARLAHAVLEELVTRSSAVIELRSPDADESAVSWLSLAATAPAGWHWALGSGRLLTRPARGSLAWAAAERGLPALALHLAAAATPPALDAVRVAALLADLAAGPDPTPPPAADEVVVAAPTDGLWRPLAAAGERAAPGPPLGFVTDLAGAAAPAVVVTPVPGTALSVRTPGGVRRGDAVVRLAAV
jgi:predicted deacylase